MDILDEVSEPSETACDRLGNGENFQHQESNETAAEHIGLSKQLMEEYNDELSLAKLDTAISLFGQALDVWPHDHPHHANIVVNLASVLGMRFFYNNQISDLDESLCLRADLMQAISSGQVLGNVRNIISTDYDATDIVQTANQILQDFRESAPLHAVNSIIFLLREALILEPINEALKFTALTTLAEGLYARFNHSDDIFDLHDAIASQEQAVKCCSHAQGDQWREQSHAVLRLSTMLGARFDWGKSRADLQKACQYFEDTTKSGVTKESVGLYNFGFATNLAERFKESGDINDLSQAVEVFREADKHFLLGSETDNSTLNNLANTLATRFREGGRQADLEDSIALHRQVLRCRRQPHPSRHLSLLNLGYALSMRFEYTGQRKDLDEAISFLRQALDLQGPIEPHRATALDNLGNALAIRFQKDRQRCDLYEAILAHEQALQLRAQSDPEKSLTLNNLGTAVLIRFKEFGHANDLDTVILRFREALKLRPSPHPLRHTSLCSLSTALIFRNQFNPENQQSDLDEAISHLRQILDSQATTHHRRPGTLICLAVALNLRSQRENRDAESGDFRESISLCFQALDLQTPPHPDRAATLTTLAAALLEYDKSEYNEAAMSSFQAAMQCSSDFGSPSQRLNTAEVWSQSADKFGHPSARTAYDAALQLLPQVAALSLNVESRQKALTAMSDGLARRAARYFIRQGNMDRAIEYLEAGRTVFWSQVLHLRSPFNKLGDIAPETAERLRIIAAALERGSHRDTITDLMDNRTKLRMEEDASQLTRLDKEWSQIIDDVRKLQGFEDFLKPREIMSLLPAAKNHPVVILVANDDISNCVIMTSTSGRCLFLPTLPSSELRKLVHLTQAAASQMSVWRMSNEETSEDMVANHFPRDITETMRNWLASENERGMRYESKGHLSDDIFRSVLETLWSKVVKPVIDFLKLQKSSEPPMLQWCPTGLFTFLPLHGAGRYVNNTAIECASDYFVSSYTPTIGALLVEDEQPNSSEPFQMMAIIDSKRLPCAQKELECIKLRVPHGSLVVFGTVGAPATVDAVFSGLSTASIVHFACHGKQDKLNPLNSSLLLEDGGLMISKIMQQPLPHGSVAFLSACETGMGDEHLPDEAMSLGACLLFSGFRSVVATMWEMTDVDGPTVADAFYEHLFQGSDGRPARRPDTKNSARALHVSVGKLRSQGVSFRRWLPFIHLGK